ncbi:excinuclease ABC subunit B [Spiroplasma sp. TIUS-1]|uniref:excinuclease ABC subunit UvrB n=1 Tax=Spiroplasma sp. TIUS-1 TaxID=216963 RepID=UPI001397881D|nr:excinuclease ABC subunit UvrB [Spiroplasma sp. TIUS-1]QHX36191.1 excinuclease ABC subunit B [Spiroplasma sp. TIUS-1]
MEKKFKLVTKFAPSGDQPLAIDKLAEGVLNKVKDQVLLGATGTGKTFTIANVINKVQKPTLVLVHNKTLAMQLYVEMQELFPNNKVEYYVSHFDFFQPEAYVAARDLYIGKDARRNADLDMMRVRTLNSLVTRDDVIVVASVAAIYPTQNPTTYEKIFLQLDLGETINLKQTLTDLIQMGYIRNDTDDEIGSFSVKGDAITIRPGWSDKMYYKISLFGDEIESIGTYEPLNNTKLESLRTLTIYPAVAYVSDRDKINIVVENIKKELNERSKELNQAGRYIELDRLQKRTNYDLDMLSEFGICSGIENYSMYLDFREIGSVPWTLIDFFSSNGFLTVIDESHMTMPQIRGMYQTDRSRKESLVEYGFRLPSAKENRPLNFEEFKSKIGQTIYVSATPSEYELELAKENVAQQIIRPTGLLDPIVEVRKQEGQIDDIIKEINLRTPKGEKVFITTLTIRSSESITEYLQDKNIKVAYIHSELKTFERSQILNDLRLGVYDVIVGVNLLREGLDIPEVSLVCILDADKQGFLRNTRSLIQTIGRAARNENGRVIFYANTISRSMEEAMEETSRRRKIQEDFNIANNIVPKTITKDLAASLHDGDIRGKIAQLKSKSLKERKTEIEKLIASTRKEMIIAARELDFETAAKLRDIIIQLEGE